MKKKVLAGFVVSVLAFAVMVVAQTDEQEVYRLQRVFSSDNELLSETITGHPWIEQANGEKLFLFDSTRSPDGTVYAVVDSVEDTQPDDGDKHSFVVNSVIEAADIKTVSWEKRVEALKEAGANEKYIQTVIDSHTDVLPVEEPYKIDPDFAEQLKNMDPDEKVTVAIQHAEQPKLALPRVDIDLDSGLPGFTWDAYINRLDAIDERIAHFEGLQAPIVEFVEANDGVVLSQHWAVNALYAAVPVWAVEDIAERDDVLLVHQTSEPQIQDIYFEDLRKVTQTEFFRITHSGLNFQGARSSGRTACTDIYVGVVDSTYFNTNHYSFRESSSGTRVFNQYDCDLGNCIEGTVNQDAAQDGHATRMVGIIGQDLMDGQDSYYTTTTDRLHRSGVAAEVEFCLISAGGPAGNNVDEFEAAIAENVDILSVSMGGSSGRTCGSDVVYYTCPSTSESRGLDTQSVTANAAFEDGVFFVNAAGNNANISKPDDYCPCEEARVLSPANASGVFAVGSYNADSEQPNSSFDTSGLRIALSANGPTIDGRIKPDILAPADQRCWARHDIDSGANGYNCTDGYEGTSNAAPVVAGAAAEFKDFLIYYLGQTAANQPGRLFANMLNFGDRKNSTSTGSDAFSPEYGAGRLRLRLPTDAGMDSPYRWQTGYISLADGESYTQYLGPIDDPDGAIDNDVEFLKAALWWPEPNTGVWPYNAQISAKLCYLNLGVWICETHTSDEDQKLQFIRDDNEANFDDFVGGKPYKLVITADFVPTGKERTIYWSYFWEDLDRDDPEGPCYSCGSGDDLYLFYR